MSAKRHILLTQKPVTQRAMLFLYPVLDPLGRKIRACLPTSACAPDLPFPEAACHASHCTREQFQTKKGCAWMCEDRWLKETLLLVSEMVLSSWVWHFI